MAIKHSSPRFPGVRLVRRKTKTLRNITGRWQVYALENTQD